MQTIEYKRGFGERKTSTNVEHIFVNYFSILFLRFGIPVFELVDLVDASERFG